METNIRQGVGSITMNQCQECDEVFKYDRHGQRLQEHYDRFHALPEFTKDGKIRLNAPHQITLIVKGDQTWEQYFKKQRKKDTSWINDGKTLQQFEIDNNVEFHYCQSGDELGFSQIEISIWQKIIKFILRR